MSRVRKATEKATRITMRGVRIVAYVGMGIELRRCRRLCPFAEKNNRSMIKDAKDDELPASALSPAAVYRIVLRAHALRSSVYLKIIYRLYVW